MTISHSLSASPAGQQRLHEADTAGTRWRRWRPYLSERRWGTVREDYSADGDAWGYLSHDQARSRAYRWGEDVKEHYFYLDNTPTHSYMRMLDKYPQRAYPYADLVATNRSRGRAEFEYELLDTGASNPSPYVKDGIDRFVVPGDTAAVRLIAAAAAVRRGRWTLPDVAGWPDNAMHRDMLVWAWHDETTRHLVAVNLSGNSSQGLIAMPWEDVHGRRWRLTDLLDGRVFDRDGDELAAQGLYVDLSPWAVHVLALEPY